ncbi:MAG: TauD/TfdA family dioxygenase [Acidobacteria bacterium]|nr:TauD/TfdA family dioxygenase [Acidobacteriota bacterium]
MEPWGAGGLPLVIQPAVEGVNLAIWSSNNRALIEAELLKYGGILFRNFKLKSVEDFERVIKAISGELMEYTYRSTPRHTVSGRIYTSTEYSADETIPLHNENAYTTSWPMKIWFYCDYPAQQGGETPIADSRNVFQRIDPQVRERFERKRVMYVRNYGDGLDLPWQTVFQTENKAIVEEYCRLIGIQFEWKNGDQLRTKQVCQAVATHPGTGEPVWFNQAHLFHPSSLGPEVRQYLLSIFGEEDLPRNAYYGDGSPIEDAVLAEIREAFKRETVIFPWENGDILMLDNMLVAHGRRSYSGPRRILAGMSEPHAEKNA